MEESSCVKCPACNQQLVVARRRVRVYTSRAKYSGTVASVLVLLSLVCVSLYLACPLPFFLEPEFRTRMEFLYISTVGSSLLLLTSAVCNGLLCYVLSLDRGSEHQGPMNYLLVIMAVADSFVSCLHIPMSIFTIWVIDHRIEWENFDENLFRKAVDMTDALKSGFASLSILSATMICLVRMYFTVRRSHSLVLPRPLKIVTMMAPFLISLATCTTYYNCLEEYWVHHYDSLVTVYIPLFLMFIVLIVTYFLNECWRCRDDVMPRSIVHAFFLCYLVLWTPWFTMDIMQEYCCSIQVEYYTKILHVTSVLFMVKCCLNLPIIVTLDARFQYACKSVLLKCCCPCNATYTTINNDLLLQQNVSETTELCSEQSAEEASRCTGHFQEMKQSLI